jgi:hypothetical protein
MTTRKCFITLTTGCPEAPRQHAVQCAKVADGLFRYDAAGKVRIIFLSGSNRCQGGWFITMLGERVNYPKVQPPKGQLTKNSTFCFGRLFDDSMFWLTSIYIYIYILQYWLT